MNHEKAIEEAAKACANELLGEMRCNFKLPIARHMRALAESILRAESQRGDTEPFHQVIVRRCHACGEDIPAIGPDFCGICLLTNPQPESEVKPCDNQDAYVEIPASAPAEPEGRLPSNAAPDVPSEGVPPAEKENPFAPSPRDWTEDASHENGNYSCHCSTCGKFFVGHKRRVTCKLCTPQPVEPERQEQCEWCGCLTTDWLDTDWSRGRICRACEDKHDPAKAQPVEPAASETPDTYMTDAFEAQRPTRIKMVDLVDDYYDALKFARDLERRLRAAEAEREELRLGAFDARVERDAALARVKKLEGAFNKYATHKDDCQIITVAFGYRVQNCTCGFDTALQP